MKYYVIYSLNKSLVGVVFAMLYNFTKWFKDKISAEQRIKAFDDVICYSNVFALLFLVFVLLLPFLDLTMCEILDRIVITITRWIFCK